MAWLGHAYYLLDDLYPRQSSTTRSLVATPGRPTTHTLKHTGRSLGGQFCITVACVFGVVHGDHDLLCFIGLFAWA